MWSALKGDREIGTADGGLNGYGHGKRKGPWSTVGMNGKRVGGLRRH